jgi:WD40 repeat protein
MPGWLVISPDGTRLAVSSGRGRHVQVRDLTTGELQATLEQPTLEVYGLAWHPTDPNLLVTTHFGIYLWDLRAPEKPRAVFPGQAGPTTNIVFSHQGEVLASKGWGDTTLRLWDTWTGRQLVQIPGTSANGHMPLQFSRDDKRLAFYHNVNQIGLWEVEIAPEFRSLASHSKLGDGQYQSLDISPDGQMLATASRYGPSNGIRMWDLATHRELAYLQVGTTEAVRFHPRGGALFSTHADKGLFHWPIRGEPDGVHVGPPRRLGPADMAGYVSIARNGRRLAVNRRNSAVVFELAGPGPPVMKGAEPGVTFVVGNVNQVALSPDGHWLAAAMSPSKGVLVFDVETRKRVKTLPARLWAAAEFSPDGKWLVTGAADEFCIYDVGTWELRHRLPRSAGGDGSGPIVFSHDGRVLAVVLTGLTVQLIDPTSARVLATLEPPEPDRNLPGALGFQPDGSQLVVGTIELRLLHIWDLRLLGQRLAELGQDWELPPYRPAEPSAGDSPLTVDVDYGDLFDGGAAGSQ